MTLHRQRIKFTNLASNVIYWRRGSNGGLVNLHDGSGVIVDTGTDETTALTLLGEVRRRGWHEPLIINTHRHSDHTAGNQLLMSKAGARLWQGSAGLLTVNGNTYADVFIQPLPGHTPDSIGIVTESVLWVGDALFAPEVLRRYCIPAFTDLATAMQSITTIERLSAERSINWCVAGHGRPIDKQSLPEVIRLNLDLVQQALNHLKRVGAGYRQPTVDGRLAEELTCDWLRCSGTSTPKNARNFDFWQRIGAAYWRYLQYEGAKVTSEEPHQ